MCPVFDIHHLIQSHNCSPQSNITSKLQNLKPNLSVVTLTLNYARSCSNIGKSRDTDIRAPTWEQITDKAAFWTQETGSEKNKLGRSHENRL